MLSTSTFVFIKTEETSTSESRRRKYRVLNIGYPFLNCRHRTKLDSEMQFHFRTRFASHVSLRGSNTRLDARSRISRPLTAHVELYFASTIDDYFLDAIACPTLIRRTCDIWCECVNDWWKVSMDFPLLTHDKELSISIVTYTTITCFHLHNRSTQVNIIPL